MEIITPLTEITQPLRGVIFDMDGVVFDTMGLVYNFQKILYDKLGDKSKKFSKYYDGWMDDYNKLYAEKNLRGIHGGISHVDWDKYEGEVWDLYRDYYDKNLAPTIKNDGVDMADVIKDIHYRGRPTKNRMSRLRIGINTTKGRHTLDKILENSKIDNYFDTIVTYDDILIYCADGVIKKEKIDIRDVDAIKKLVPAHMKDYLEKPNGLSSMMTINAMGMTPKDVIVFEDTSNGIMAYKPVLSLPNTTSAYVVAVTDGYVSNRNELKDAGADIILDSRKEIVPLIEMLGGFI